LLELLAKGVDMKLCKYLSVSIFAVAISNFSYASPVGQTLSCPSVAQIKEMCDHKGGCFYEAIAANGQKWRGENPMGSKGGVATFAFNEAYIRNDGTKEKYIACDYFGNTPASGARMALFYDVRMNAAPIGNSWKNEEQPSPNKGLVLARCPEYSPSPNSSPVACTFKISNY
jgi:Protein of unknown function (DUF3757)